MRYLQKFSISRIIVLSLGFLSFFDSPVALPGPSDGSKLQWEVLGSDKLEIVYHKGLERAARQALGIAEAAYERISAYLQADAPRKISVVLMGYDDPSGGYSWQGLTAARGFTEREETIWHILFSTGGFQFDLLGTSQDGDGGLLLDVNPSGSSMVVWLPSPVKDTPGTFSWLVRTVAYGIGRMLIYHRLSLEPIPAIGIGELHALSEVPVWFAEGLAQHLAGAWDSYYESFLRAAVLGNRMLPYRRLVAGSYGLSFEERILLYIQAHSMIRYISDEFGKGALLGILSQKRGSLFDFDGVLRRVVGVDGSELYRNWRKSLVIAYGEEVFGREDMDGKAKRLTGRAGFKAHPSFSPDGRSIAFVSSSDNDFAVGSLWVIDDLGEEAKKLTEGVNFDPSWSPDGRRIAYSKTILHEGFLTSDIYLIGADGKGETRLTKGVRGSEPAWSPDGKNIAFVRNVDGGSEIFRMDEAGGSLVQLTRSDGLVQNYSPQWSHGGDRIAFSIFREGKRDIAVMGSDGSNISLLTDDVADDRTPVWLPGDKRLLFLSDRDGQGGALYTVPSTGGQPEKVISAIGVVSDMDVSLDGRRLAFSAYSYHGFHIYTMALDLKESEEKSEPTDSYHLQSSLISPLPPGGGGLGWGGGDGRNNIAPLSLIPPHEGEGDSSKAPPQRVAVSPQRGAEDGIEMEGPSSPYNPLHSLERPFFLPYGYYLGDRMYRAGFVASFKDVLDQHSLDLRADYNRMAPELSLQGSYATKAIPLPVGFAVRYHRSDGAPPDGAWQSESVAAELSVALNIDRFGSLGGSILSEKLNINRSGALAELDEGLISAVGLRWVFSQMIPRADGAINPSGGRRLDLRMERGDKLIYSDFDFTTLRLDYREYLNLDQIAPHNVLAVRLVGGMMEGDPPHQHLFLLDGNIPLVEDPPNALTIRGSSGVEVGSRVAFVSGEYRFPVFRDMSLTLLDFLSPWSLYFEGMYGAFFIEAGKAWNGQLKISRGEAIRSGVGVEVRQRFLGLGGGAILRIGLAGEPSFASVFHPYVSIGGIF